MSTDKFLDLDIRKLFEEHTIKDIELIQKQIQHESDRKKIELRTLVGERYRDLIQAADSISEMKQTSESVNEKIVSVERTFHELQQKYLIGFKMETEQKILQKQSSSISDSVVMQIKILTDIPEQIWSAIDVKDFLYATELFLLAQHINYSLAFEVGDSTLAHRYPIVSKQWGIINQFKSLLLNFCNNTLQAVQLPQELAANCLAALVFLDGLNSLELLNRLISFRSQAVQSIICLESNLSVKDKIKLSSCILMEMVPLISTSFIRCEDSEDGLVMMYTNRVKDKNAFSMLGKLDVNEELIDKFLPMVAKNHKPFQEYSLKKLSPENINESINNLFQWMKQLAEVEVTKLFDLVLSIKGIFNIREECLAVEVPANWDQVWETFSLPTVNFWMEFFQPLLTERVKGILRDKLNICLIALKNDLVDTLTRVSVESYKYQEYDLRWFVWKESSSDIPHKLIDGGSSDNKRPLLMKARGFSPNILQLCENFESGLSEVLKHLRQYLYEDESSTTLKDDLLVTDIYLSNNKFCDRSEIQEYLQVISEKLIDDFMSFVKEECMVENTNFGHQSINATVIARFLQAVPILCSNFKECFVISKPSGLTLTNAKWQEICDKLKKESTLIWSIWAKCFVRTIISHKGEYLAKETIDTIRIQTVITDWEKVTIEEEAEEGKRIKSEILVPYQSAVHLQKFLAFICKELNKVIPHTIPKTVLNGITNSIASEVFDYYYKISTELEIRQKQAIQILFDVKFVTLLMVSRDNKLLTEQSTKVNNAVISKIDPFDFDVFCPFINTNVKKAVQRSLLIYGNLVPHIEQLHSVLGARIEHSEGFKPLKDPPGVLALCSPAPWFPPLAVTAPAKTPSATAQSSSEKVQQQQQQQQQQPQQQPKKKKQQPGKEHSRNDSTGSTIKSGAAAFFGAMGGEWFGTS